LSGRIRTLALVGTAGLLFAAGLGLGTLLRSGAPEEAAMPVSEPASDSGGPVAAEPTSARTAGTDEAPSFARRARAAEAPDSVPANDRRTTATVAAARAVTPSVVSVNVVATQTTQSSDLFGNFFFPFGTRRQVRGLGSGFAIDDRGYILTNTHVVENATRIVVVDASGRRYTASLVGSDALTDVALLKIPAGRVPPAPLGTSADLMVGEPAIAIGNPFGFYLSNTEATVTSGVVSGVNRDYRGNGDREVLYADMIQTDAAINPGNSGGPLVNADGRVVGVNSFILSQSGGSEGLGFAIPIDRALRIADELRRFGRIRRPYVGLDVATVTSDSLVARTVVRRVAPGSPAAQAGVHKGDVILTLNGTRIRGPLDWEVALLDAGAGSTAEVRFLRDGQTHDVRMAVRELPSEEAHRVEVLRGLQLVTVTPQIAVERHLEVEQGALIVDVSGDVASATGMREGDVIVAIDRREVKTADDAAQMFQAATARGFVRVWLYRAGESLVTSFGLR
jgi:serine protease Do